MSCTFAVLDSDGNSFTVPVDILDSDGNSFTVGIAVLDSDGNSFDCGVCTAAPVASSGTEANAGGGGRKKKQNLPFYEGKNYGDSRLDVDAIVQKRSEDKVVKERTTVKAERKQAKGMELNELVAKIELPAVEMPKVVEEDTTEDDIERAVVLLLLKH